MIVPSHDLVVDARAAGELTPPQDPDYDPSGPYPDHLYLYTGGVDSYHYAATRSQQWPPNTVGSYRNTDPVLISYVFGVQTIAHPLPRGNKMP
jgi:hypothetical protein